MLVLDGKTFATTWPFFQKFPFFQKQNTYNFTKIYPILTWFFGSLIYKGTRVPGDSQFFMLKQGSKKNWGEMVLGTCQRLFRGILTKSTKTSEFSELDVI